MKNKINGNSNTAKIVVIGASVAAAAATAYFFLGPDGKTHQKHAKAWAIKMKGEVVKRLEAAREVSEPVYHTIIDGVAAEFTKAMNGDRKDIDALAADMKKHWKAFVKAAESKSKKA